MVWKQVVNADVGDADHFGGDDVDKISKLFSAVNVDNVDIDSDWSFRTSRLKIRNPANTFSYTFVPSAIAAARTITLPLITASDTFAVLGIGQTFTADQTFAGGLIAQGALTVSGHICPPQITADQNDYNPTGLSTTVKINLNGDSNFRAITGLAGGVDGRVIKMTNTTDNTILLDDQNTGSTAANRFDLGGYDIPLFKGSSVELIYDAIPSRWRITDQPTVYIQPIARNGVYAMAHYLADTGIESGLFTEVVPSGGTATAANGVPSHHGILDITLGTSATGSGTSKLNNSCILLGNLWYWKYESIIKLTVLSSADPDYTFRSGFIDSGTAESTDGVFFRYNDNVNTGEYQLVARSNNTETATDTNTVPVAGNWTRLTIIVNPAGTLASGFINGSSVGTVASNIPTGTGRVTGAGCMFLKTAGTTDASLLQIDSQEITGYANVSN